MIPIYFENIETAFTSNGLGRLVDCISCTVTEERNGVYECEFTYPITGRFYNALLSGGIIGVIHDDHHDIQPFDIYKHSAPIDGVVTFNASHISYRLNKIPVMPFSASSCALALQGIADNAVTDCPFTFWTDKETAVDFALTVPKNGRAILGGEEGSILDTFGSGEYQFDKFAVRLYASRGTDSGVTIRYGKNLTSVQMVQDRSSAVTGVLPYWTDGTTTIIGTEVIAPYAPESYPWTEENGVEITDENGDAIEIAPAVITVVPYDFSGQFEEAPSLAELEQAAEDYLDNNTPWIPTDNIDIDFVQLWQTPEYANVAALQRVGLCDTVSVYYPELGVIATEQKVIKTVYNVLLERFDAMTLGQLQTTLSEAISGTFQAQLTETQSALMEAIAHATELITGGLGGHVVFTMNANGEPQEIIIMDTDDTATAVNVIRMNKNGIGFSTSGYNGPFASAWTIDGKFNADFIAAGHLLANYIQGGTLTLGGNGNGNGVLRILDSSGNVITTGDMSGISTTYLRAALNSTNYALFSSSGLRFYLDDAVVYNGSTRHYSLPDSTSLEYSQGNLTFEATPGSDTLFGLIDAEELLFSASRGGSTYRRIDFGLSTGLQFYTDSLHASIGMAGGASFASLRVSGTKSRVVSTEDYADRLLYCYETPSPMFGDVGEGVIGEDGLCYVWLDPVFAETISNTQYQAFLQAYGEGSLYVTERKPGYFCVKGTPGLAFGWEIKAKQADFDQLRLERKTDDVDITNADYGFYAIEYLEKLKGART